MAVNQEAIEWMFHPKTTRYTVPFGLLASIASSTDIAVAPSTVHPVPYGSRLGALGQRSEVFSVQPWGDLKHASAISFSPTRWGLVLGIQVQAAKLKFKAAVHRARNSSTPC